MVTPEQINNNNLWFNKIITLLSTEFGPSLRENTGYKRAFMRKVETVSSDLRTTPRDFTNDPQRYFMHIKRLFSSLYDAVDFLAKIYKLTGVQRKILDTAAELTNEMDNVEHIDEVKTLFNDVLTALDNQRIIVERSQEVAMAK